MFKDFEFIIVGAGLSGATIGQLLAEDGHKVCLLEKRGNIGGNCHDKYDAETNILTHTYGPHIFHADDEDVINYLNKFTEFNRYFHQVISLYQNKIYQLPFNLETVNTFYNLNLKPFELENFLAGEAAKESIINPTNMEEKAVSLIGRRLYEAFIREYTIKQWGKDPRELPESIINRIPVRSSYYEGYYNKNFHGMPVGGYAKMFDCMLRTPNIKVMLNTDYFSVRKLIPADKIIIFTGPIDKFFDYKYGRLEYRRVSFVRELHKVQDWQGTSVVNYPELKYEYTRICEPRHFYRENWNQYSPDSTVIFKEISSLDDGTDPYYPINDAKNTDLAAKYQREATQLQRVFFAGRLGEFKYYDMEDAIKAAFELVKRLQLCLPDPSETNSNNFQPGEIK